MTEPDPISTPVSTPETPVDDGAAAIPTSPGAIVTQRDPLQREIRSWGWWLLAMGAIQLVASNFASLSAPWGIFCLIMGGLSFFIHEPAMLVLYGVMLAWAAFSNMLGGNMRWIIFAAYQVYLAYRIFSQFSRHQRAEKAALESGEHPLSNRATRYFPLASCLIGAASLTMLIVLFFWIVMRYTQGQADSSVLDFLYALNVDLSVLGLALGLASLLARFRNKGLAIAGLSLSGVVLLLALAIRYI